YFAFYGDNHNIGAFTANRHLKVQTIPGGSKTVILSDGDTGAEIGSSNVALTHNGTGEMTIFAADANGDHAASYRLHGFKLTHQGTVVRDFVPVERTADNKAGLYDLANDTFYPSNGTADFVMGPGSGEFFGLEDNKDVGVFHVDVAEGKRIENDTAVIGGKVRFVKSGAGEYVERVAQDNTGGVTLEGGTFSWAIDAPAVTGPLTFAGGTLVVEDGHPVDAMGGASVTAPSVIAFGRGAKFGRRAAILNFGAETPLTQLTLVVTPDSGCAASLALDGDDLQVMLGGASDVVDAVWTGAADDAASNPANWICTDPFGAQIVNGLPSWQTSVHIAGEISLQVPADSGFVCAEVVLDDCTLAADCDWRGFGGIQIFGTIDLAGHNLYTADVTGTGTILSGEPNGYRFYRFKVDATGGNDFQISEIELFNGLTLITGQRTAVHWRKDNYPSNFNPTYNPEAALNGNLGTKWYDNRAKDDIWVTVEYAEPVFVTRYKWYTGDDTQRHSERNPTAWRLQASNDNVTWTDLDVVTGATPPAANKTLAYIGLVNSNLGGDGSELHIEVAKGTCQTNSTVTLAGRLKLVKDGGGTLVMAKSGQSYGGGTTVTAGYLKPGLREDTSLFGATSSTITVGDGAQFLDDIFCVGVTCDIDWVIAGSGPDGTGAIRATARTPGKNNSEVAWGRSLTLMGDATIGSDEYAFDFVAPNYVTFPVTLNGHTLTLKSSYPMSSRQHPFFLASGLLGTDEGTFVVGDNLCFYPYKDSVSVLPNVTFVVSARGEYRTDTDPNARDMTVSNLVYRSESNVSQLNRTTTVLGAYTPASVTSAPKVQLGDEGHLDVALDLSERTTEFDTAFGGGLTFTEGSRVTVKLGSRQRSQAERLVAWADKPSGVTFVGESPHECFWVLNDGLYLASGTLVIIR
ncbi:MAG: discoidin domain-containing protein, partial [Kiritimatiellae bacterium]|nr:discoidin domain-containing protein [Kiritimatiellia bacterium]